DGGLAGHGVTPNTGAADGLVVTRRRPERAVLEAEVRERLVGFCHTVNFVALLHRAAAAFGGLQQLVGQALRHRLLAALAGGIFQPAHRQRHAAHGANFHGNLVVRAADAAAIDVDHRLYVVQRGQEHLHGVLAGLLLDLLERAVDDALGHGLLAGLHDDVHELGQIDRAELRIGQDLALGDFATTWHGTLPSLASVGARLLPCTSDGRSGPSTYSTHHEAGHLCRPSGPAFLFAQRYAFLGRFAPYLERDCLRSLTPCRSSEPRTMW